MVGVKIVVFFALALIAILNGIAAINAYSTGKDLQVAKETTMCKLYERIMRLSLTISILFFIEAIATLYD